jgi:hypothetical protein
MASASGTCDLLLLDPLVGPSRSMCRVLLAPCTLSAVSDYQALYRKYRPQTLLRGCRPGSCHRDARRRGHRRQGRTCLPVRRSAGHREDDHGSDPGQGDQLCRPSARGRTLQRVQLLREHHCRHVDGCGRTRCGLTQQGRGRARDPGQCRHRGECRRGAAGVHPRRGAHVVSGRIERTPQDPRGATRARPLRPGHHRAVQASRHDSESSPAVRLPRHRVGGPCRPIWRRSLAPRASRRPGTGSP